MWALDRAARKKYRKRCTAPIQVVPSLRRRQNGLTLVEIRYEEGAVMAGQNKINGDMGMECCTLCPGECRADRTRAAGFCGMGDEVTIDARPFICGRSLCISGERRFGNRIFRAAHCAASFCQNYRDFHTEKGL